MRRRALLVSGGLSRWADRRRYANDLVAAYRLLTQVAGFSVEDTRVCYRDGAAGRFGGRMPAGIVRSASHAEVVSGLSWLAELEDCDLAVLLVTNHGDGEGFFLWGPGPRVSPDEVESALSACAATKLLVFGQCRAGRFAQLSGLGSAVVCLACEAHQDTTCFAFPTDDDPDVHDEFMYHFIGALSGKYPDGRRLSGQLDGPRRVSVAEAFRYARDHSRCPDETPSLLDPAGLADTLVL